MVYFHPAGGLTWDAFLDRLAIRHTVYAPEHPGTSVDDPNSIHQVDTLWDLILIYEELMRRLGLQKPVAVGQSFGGMMALELAACFPDLFSRVVVLDPIGLWRDDAPVSDWATQPATKMPELLFYDPQGEAAKSMFSLPEDSETAIQVQAAFGWAIACTGKFVWPIPDKGLVKRLHRIKTPTLIIWGKEDRLIPVVYAQEFSSRISNSQVAIIERCGHIPQMEQLEQTYNIVNEFLGNL